MNSPLFLIPLIAGPVFIITGWILLKYPPKKINLWYGYRTRNSMKNLEVWNFAQVYSAKEMMKAGFLLSVTSILGLFFKPSEFVSAFIAFGILFFIIFIFIFRVEKAISKRLNALE